MLVTILLIKKVNFCNLEFYGGYSSTVRTSVCGTDDLGSIPSSHPK